MSDYRDEHPELEPFYLIATHLKYLGNGNAGSPMGAIEHLAVKINEGLESLAGAIENYVDHGANEVAVAIEKNGKSIKEGLDALASAVDTHAEAMDRLAAVAEFFVRQKVERNGCIG